MGQQRLLPYGPERKHDGRTRSDASQKYGSAATQVVGHITPVDLLKTALQKPGYGH